MPNLNLGPGFYDDISEADYHADRVCAEPTLSRSAGKLFLTHSPLHFWHAHPRLGAKSGVEDEDETPPPAAGEPSRAMDYGSLGHALLLGKGAQIAIGDWKTWQSNDAKLFRKAARASGQIPCLRASYDKAVAMRNGAIEQLKALDLHTLFTAAKSEVTAIFDQGENCRVRVRYDKLLLTPTDATILDVKITESAKPQTCERQIENMLYDYQESVYRAGVTQLAPHVSGRDRFIFLFIETKPPFVVTPIELDGAFKTNGTIKWNYVLECWNACRKRNQWPAYTREVVRATPQDWALLKAFGLTAPSFKE